MTVNVQQDWPVYFLLGAVIFFYIFVIINSHKQEKIQKEEGKNKKDKGQ